MDGDIVIDAGAARQLHSASMADGCLVIWAVFEKPLDYPEQFVARPQLVGHGRAGPEISRYVLVADSLPALRFQLPAALYRLPRQVGDPQYLVEVFL